MSRNENIVMSVIFQIMKWKVFPLVDNIKQVRF